MENNRYENFGVNLSTAQAKKIINASKKHAGVRIRLSKNNLVGSHKLPLTKTQINRLTKSKTGVDLNLSAAQLKYCEKNWWIFTASIADTFDFWRINCCWWNCKWGFSYSKLSKIFESTKCCTGRTRKT